MFAFRLNFRCVSRSAACSVHPDLDPSHLLDLGIRALVRAPVSAAHSRHRVSRHSARPNASAILDCSYVRHLHALCVDALRASSQSLSPPGGRAAESAALCSPAKISSSKRPQHSAHLQSVSSKRPQHSAHLQSVSSKRPQHSAHLQSVSSNPQHSAHLRTRCHRSRLRASRRLPLCLDASRVRFTSP